MNPIDIPLQIALSRLSHQSPILAQLNSARIFTLALDPTSYHLDTRRLQPKHVLQCWTSHNGQLEKCPPEQYLARRNIRGIDHTEFSILEQQGVAYIVWEWAIYGMGRGGCGGTYVLQKSEKGWIPISEMGHSWRS